MSVLYRRITQGITDRITDRHDWLVLVGDAAEEDSIDLIYQASFFEVVNEPHEVLTIPTLELIGSPIRLKPLQDIGDRSG